MDLVYNYDFKQAKTVIDMNQKPLILITNDDGISAKGINELIYEAVKYGDICVVAPNGPRSAQSSALTIESPISVTKLGIEECQGNSIVRYAISGTPTDCVKVAIDKVLDRTPDLLLSGINHGSNASINVLYSGTLGAAIEGSLHDVPSVGFSLWDHHKDADFSHCLPYFSKIIKVALENKMPRGICLNVNAPKGDISGIKLARQSDGRWANEYQKDNAPRTSEYYWLIGDFIYKQDESQSEYIGDQTALEQGYISVVPIHTDMTAYHVMSCFKEYENIR